MVSSLSFVVTLTLIFSVCGKSFVPQMSSQDRCPPEDDIYPCYCYVDSFDAALFSCERTHDLEQVKGILEKTKGYNVSISFWNARLGDIPSDLFEGQITSSLHFQDCRIGSFGEKPFTGLENTLESVFIYGSVDKRRKDLKTMPLGHLKKLKYFSFQANDIIKLGNEWFEGGPASLEELSLEANDIEVIEDKAFVSLVNLKQIWLGDNRFGLVSRSMFPKPANKLEILEVSFNGIQMLPEDLFSEMPSLKIVNVAGNKIQTLEENIWKNIWEKLDEVYVDRNPLVCDKKLKWIYSEDRKLPNIFDGKCAGYNDLRGKKLEELTLKDFE